MLDGILLVGLLAAAVAFIVIATAKLNLHAFITLLVASYATGILAGLDPTEVTTLVTDGFGGVLAYIGIVIVAGTIIGTALERSGAAIVIAEAILDVIGEEYTPQVMALTGSLVSIPVFCDSGFIVLSGLARSIAERSKLSLAAVSVALASGLYVTHVFVPPTPGPIAAAGIIGADIGLVILAGIVVSLPITLIGAFWASRIASRFHIDPAPEVTLDEVRDEYGTLPSTGHAFAPILVPIALIALGSVFSYPSADAALTTLQSLLGSSSIATSLQNAMLFLGDPAVALLIGAFVAFTLVPVNGTVTDEWVSDGIRDSAIVLAVTGAGGAFGQVLGALPLQGFIESTFGGLGIGLLAAFIIAAALKTALGSSTVAIVTTAGLVASILPTLGLASTWGKVFAVLAIGAGSMTVSHANDSYFWIITEFSDMETSTAYQAWTAATLVLGLSSIVWIVILRNVVSLLA